MQLEGLRLDLVRAGDGRAEHVVEHLLVRAIAHIDRVVAELGALRGLDADGLAAATVDASVRLQLRLTREEKLPSIEILAGRFARESVEAIEPQPPATPRLASRPPRLRTIEGALGDAQRPRPCWRPRRVKTVATVARKRAPNTDPPSGHEVFFVQFRRPLLELLGPPTAANRWRRVEELLSDMQRVQSDDEPRVRAVRQADLDADADWSPPLRAPDIYEQFIALPGVTTVCSQPPQPQDPYVLTVGPKLGSTWFVVRDVGDNVSDAELADWGVTRKQVIGPTARYRIVQGGDWRGPVESRYLKQWVRGPGDEPTRTLSRDAGDLIITIPRSPALPGPPRSASTSATARSATSTAGCTPASAASTGTPSRT